MLYFYTCAEKQIIIKVWIPGISWPKLVATKTQEYAICTSKSAKNRFASLAMVPIQNYLSQMLKCMVHLTYIWSVFYGFHVCKYTINRPIEWTWVWIYQQFRQSQLLNNDDGFLDTLDTPIQIPNHRAKQPTKKAKKTLIRWCVFFHIDVWSGKSNKTYEM